MTKEQMLKEIKDRYIKQEVMVPMRDGVKLHTSIYIPRDSTERHPILLSRTSYGTGSGEDYFPMGKLSESSYYGKAKYILVYQDVRGRYFSEGEFVQVRPLNKNIKNRTSKKALKDKKNIDEATDTYGSINQAKEVTRWVFDNKEGKASNIITVNNNYFFIAAVKAIHKEGYAPVEEMATNIKLKLYNDKLHAKATAEMAEKIAGMTDLEAVAEKLNTQVQTLNAASFSTFGSYSADPALIGAASVAENNKISGPVAGATGVYVFKVSDKQVGEFYTEDDARNFEMQKSQYMSQLITAVMMDNDDVKDNRARFF